MGKGIRFAAGEGGAASAARLWFERTAVRLDIVGFKQAEARLLELETKLEIWVTTRLNLSDFERAAAARLGELVMAARPKSDG